MPFRLIYSSEASPDLVTADLEGMLAESRIRSRAHGITGVLVFVDGAFLQILEGEKNDVMDLMERIERDPRHRGVKVVALSRSATPTYRPRAPSGAPVSRWATSTATVATISPGSTAAVDPRSS